MLGEQLRLTRFFSGKNSPAIIAILVMAFAVSPGAMHNSAERRRNLGGFLGSFAIHIIAVILLSLWHLSPPPVDLVRERVQAVELTDTPPPEEPFVEAEKPQPDTMRESRGGGDRRRQVEVRAPDEAFMASMAVAAPIGLPPPRLELARPTPALLGGSPGDAEGRGAGAGMGLGPGPGAGSGMGDGTGTGLERKLTTRWAPSWDPRRLRRFYPRAALAKMLPGQVVLECTVVRDDRVRDCVARAAGPVGQGFEEAAVQAEKVYRVQVHDQNGVQVYNERILIHATFRPQMAGG